MSAPYFIGSSSPAIAYSPRYAPGYSALSGLKNKGLCKKTSNVPTERNANNKLATHDSPRRDVLRVRV